MMMHGADAQAGTTAAERMAFIEGVLRAEAKSVEAEYMKVVGEAPQQCQPIPVSACAPRSEMVPLVPNNLFTPETIPEGRTAADYEINFGMTQATYQVDLGTTDPDWKTNYQKNPPSATRTDQTLCSLKPLDAQWQAYKNAIGGAPGQPGSFWQPVKILQRTFLG